MNKSILVLIVLTISACNSSSVEEYAFRKTIELSLTETCGAQDKACAEAVKSQLSGLEVVSEKQRGSGRTAAIQQGTVCLYCR